MSLDEKLKTLDTQIKYLFDRFEEMDKMIHGQIGLVITEETTHSDGIKAKLDAIEKKLEAIENKID
jgi:uncharacterized protein YdcH (DUF465 family)